MAKIPMTQGFVMVPEGTHVFRIYEVTYDEDFGRMVVSMVNAEGITHKERFSVKNADGTYNEKALNAFSYFAKTALQDFAREEIDEQELVDKFIKITIVHTVMPSKNDPTKNVTFANSGDKAPADGFEKEACKRALTLGKPVNVDLDSVLD